MKKLNETTFNLKSDDFTKAVSYSKRLLKKKLYHSKTMERKLSERFTPRVVEKTMNFLQRESYFDNEMYIQKLKKLCKQKFYGIKRFKKILNEKGIYNKEDCYGCQEEGEVLVSFLNYCEKKYENLEVNEYVKKLTYLIKYKGFSETNIERYLRD